MDIVNLIYSIPTLLLFFIIIVITMSISIFCLYFIDWIIPIKSRYRESQNLGYTGTTVGIIYAIIAGFTISYLMNNYNQAAEIVEDEANVSIKIFRTAGRMPEPLQTTIKNTIVNYVNTVVDIEWPKFEKGEPSQEGFAIINQLNQDIIAYPSKDNILLLAKQTLFDQINQLYDFRNQRIQISKSNLIMEQWILILVSTFLTILVNSLLGMEFQLHFITQLAVTLMVAAILYLIVSLDRPFSGNFSVKTSAFTTVLSEMGANGLNRNEKQNED